MARPKRDDVTVKIANRVYRKAKTVAAHKGIHLAEYLSRLLAPLVERDHRKMMSNPDNDDEET